MPTIKLWQNYDGTTELTAVDPTHGHTIRSISKHSNYELGLVARDAYLRENPDASDYHDDVNPFHPKKGLPEFDKTRATLIALRASFRRDLAQAKSNLTGAEIASREAAALQGVITTLTRVDEVLTAMVEK